MKLLITGKMGSGKGEAAKYLVKNHAAHRWTRSELMKQLSHAAVDGVGDMETLLGAVFPDEEERTAVRNEILRYVAHYQPEEGKARALYQDITEICQQHDPLCFEVELNARINRALADEFHVIDDVRKRDAFDFFRNQGYATLRVEAPLAIREERMLARDGALPDKSTYEHASEIDLDNVVHDFTIDNSSNQAGQLETQLDWVVAQMQANDERQQTSQIHSGNETSGPRQISPLP